MTLKTILMAGALSLAGAAASASCAFENTVPLKSLTAGFEAWNCLKMTVLVVITQQDLQSSGGAHTRASNI